MNENHIKYSLKLTVRNQPGVLIRCAQVFTKRGGNIESLKVIPHADNHELSNMTICVFCPSEKIDNITKQLVKLIDVVSVKIA